MSACREFLTHVSSLAMITILIAPNVSYATTEVQYRQKMVELIANWTPEKPVYSNFPAAFNLTRRPELAGPLPDLVRFGFENPQMSYLLDTSFMEELASDPNLEPKVVPLALASIGFSRMGLMNSVRGVLTDLLSSSSPTVRADSVRALTDLMKNELLTPTSVQGAKNAPILAKLKQLYISDSNPLVRRALEYCIQSGFALAPPVARAQTFSPCALSLRERFIRWLAK